MDSRLYYDYLEKVTSNENSDDQNPLTSRIISALRVPTDVKQVKELVETFLKQSTVSNDVHQRLISESKEKPGVIYHRLELSRDINDAVFEQEMNPLPLDSDIQSQIASCVQHLFNPPTIECK